MLNEYLSFEKQMEDENKHMPIRKEAVNPLPRVTMGFGVLRDAAPKIVDRYPGYTQDEAMKADVKRTGAKLDKQTDARNAADAKRASGDVDKARNLQNAGGYLTKLKKKTAESKEQNDLLKKYALPTANILKKQMNQNTYYTQK